MRITKKLLQTRVNTLNEHGANLSLEARNGWYAIDSANSSRNFFAGTASQCYYYLQGLFAALYRDVTFSA